MTAAWKTEWKKLLIIVAVFAALYFMPAGWGRFDNAVGEALQLTRWYAREHVLLCLVPAFLIAGAIGAFVSSGAVMKYLGAKANKLLAYGVASISGSVLAVCSCTVLPLFAGIYRMGAGIGPATAFLYSGPAINVLAIVLTAGVLGWKLGLARAVGAVVFSVVIGLLMQLIYRREELAKAQAQVAAPEVETSRPLWKNAVVLATMVAAMIFANWSVSGQLTVGIRCCPSPQARHITEYVEGQVVSETDRAITLRLPNGQVKTYEKDWIGSLRTLENPVYVAIHKARFVITGAAVAALILMLAAWFRRPELAEWGGASWAFAKQILPLLLIGVLVAGFLLGRPRHDGLIPSRYVQTLVGERPDAALATTGATGTGWEGPVRALWPAWTNLFASVVGAFMYFATLTEVPIVEGLMGAGMGKGPALALLLAGPALSLPNMLVIRSVIGTRKTVVYSLLVVVMATLSGMIFGAVF
ncbi:MAG TPA: permease [Phycisphaerae bacterium]|nr:permease [Phycisphaerae bacterium]